MKTGLYKRGGKLGLLLLVLALAGCNSVNDRTTPDSRPGGNHVAGSFVWHDLITHDMQSARDFYGGLFNWKFEQVENRQGNPYLLARVEDRYAVGFLEVDRPVDGSNYTRWLGYMAVDQLDQALAETRSSGGKVVTGTEVLNEVGRAAAIEDSQQAILGLIESDFNTSNIVLREAPGAVVWNELLATNSRDAAGFYSAVADISTTTLQRRGGEYTLLQSDGNDLAGILDNPFQSAGPLWLTHIAVLDPAVTVAKVESLGGKVLLAPSPELREGSMALIQDPGGAILALQKWPRQ